MTRLICPNCGAQYEVDDDVIPTAGRDVQCSNCGHTWFEKPGTSLSDEGPEGPSYDEPTFDEEVEADAQAETEAAEFADPAEAVQPPAEEPAAARDVAEIVKEDTTSDADKSSEKPQALPHVQRPALDASVAEILRAEAAHEEAVRKAESDPIETQSDLGLDDPAPAPRPDPKEAEAKARIDRLKGTEPSSTTSDAASNRRELLPDIEEINSTLRPETEREIAVGIDDDDDDEFLDDERRGFRFGFFTVLAVIVALWLLYIFAEDLAQAVPALTEVLAAYVDAVDRARIWVDLRIKDLLAILQDGDAATPAE